MTVKKTCCIVDKTNQTFELLQSCSETMPLKAITVQSITQLFVALSTHQCEFIIVDESVIESYFSHYIESIKTRYPKVQIFLLLSQENPQKSLAEIVDHIIFKPVIDLNQLKVLFFSKTNPMALKKQILLAEDDKFNQQIATELLTKEGYQVHIVENGQAAVDKIQQGKEYSLILMDLNMPIMGGLTAIKKIQSLTQYNFCPIIVMTANEAPDIKIRCDEMGIADLIIKPFHIQEFLKTIKKWTKETLIKKGKNIITIKETHFSKTKKQIINPKLGLLMVDQNVALYQFLLTQFRKTHQQTILHLIELKESHVFYEIQKINHKLISAAGVIGAEKLVEATKQLQIQLQQSKLPNEKEWQAYIDILSAVIEFIPKIKGELNGDYQKHAT